LLLLALLVLASLASVTHLVTAVTLAKVVAVEVSTLTGEATALVVQVLDTLVRLHTVAGVAETVPMTATAQQVDMTASSLEAQTPLLMVQEQTS
jgi:hypothetical protein